MIPGHQPSSGSLSLSSLSNTRFSRSLLLFWLTIAFAMPVWMHFTTPGWDVDIYHSAIRSLAAGHDPYADAIALQNAFHVQHAPGADAAPPYSYVYSPITLPLLRVISTLPILLAGSLYWIVYLIAILLQLWACMQAAQPKERQHFLYIAAVASFFPGLLANGTVLSGNIAYILYAALFGTAVLGWRRGTWVWFYIAVVIASCVKAPLLSLVIIPVLSARRQWIPTAFAIIAGLALFFIQPHLWPDLFHNYLQAVELQFSYNRDFGCSPAGLFSGVLYDHGIPYLRPSMFFYLGYAVPLAAVLFSLSRRFFRGEFPLRQWIPVLLTGVILLNPRLQEYDVAAITVPLAFIAWRFFSSRHAFFLFLTLLAFANALGLYSWDLRKVLDGPLIIFLFIAGCWTLRSKSMSTT